MLFPSLPHIVQINLTECQGWHSVDACGLSVSFLVSFSVCLWTEERQRDKHAELPVEWKPGCVHSPQVHCDQLLHLSLWSHTHTHTHNRRHTFIQSIILTISIYFLSEITNKHTHTHKHKPLSHSLLKAAFVSWRWLRGLVWIRLWSASGCYIKVGCVNG